MVRALSGIGQCIKTPKRMPFSTLTSRFPDGTRARPVAPAKLDKAGNAVKNGPMPLIRSLRAKLMLLFICAVMVPSILMPLLISSYSKDIIVAESRTLTDSVIRMMGRTIQMYQNDLERLTIVPYLNDDIMYAIKYKSSSAWALASDYDRLVADRALNSTLPMYMQNTRADILNFALILRNDAVFFANKSSYTNLVNGYDYTKQAWFQAAIKADGKAIFTGIHRSDYLTSSNDKPVFSVARMIKDPDSKRYLGVIVADADTNVLSGLLNGVDFDVSSKIAILGEDGKLIHANAPLSPEVLDQLAKGVSTVSTREDSYQVVSSTVPGSNWRISVLLSNRELSSRVLWIYLVGAFFMAVGIGMAVFLYRSVSSLIVAPIETMIGVMKLVQTGNFDVPVEIEGKYEISDLADALDRMIRELKDHINREYVAALDKKTADYSALQSQIRPHFLYNTLNGFLGLNRKGERDKLEKSILDLTDMMRYIQDDGDWVLLEQELEFLDSYCRLQKLRFPDRLDFEIQCDPALRRMRIPKLLIQPIVENSIIHGVEPLDRPCRILVSVLPETDGFVTILVKDDGAGFNGDDSGPDKGIGLSNVAERLSLSFHDGSFSISSDPGKGTTVRIRLPPENLEITP
jgi:two-component system, sensor histidine kinase YesM